MRLKHFFANSALVLAKILEIACIRSSPTFGSLAQMEAKKVVKSEADLPRFNYPISGTATELLQSDDATFGKQAAR